MRVYELSAPAVEPLAYAEVAAHLRLDGSAQQTLIESYIKAARMAVENLTARALINRSLRLVLDEWEGVTTLPKPPVSAITSISVLLLDGSSVTVPPTACRLLIGDAETRLLIPNTAAVASPGLEAGGILIDYTAGYGSSAAAVPQAFKTAMMLLIGLWYDQRVAVTTPVHGLLLPQAVAALLEPYKIRRLG